MLGMGEGLTDGKEGVKEDISCVGCVGRATRDKADNIFQVVLDQVLCHLIPLVCCGKNQEGSLVLNRVFMALAKVTSSVPI